MIGTIFILIVNGLILLSILALIGLVVQFKQLVEEALDIWRDATNSTNEDVEWYLTNNPERFSVTLDDYGDDDE